MMDTYSFNEDDLKIIKKQTVYDLNEKSKKIGNGLAFYFIYDKTCMDIAANLLGQEKEYEKFEDFVSTDELNITKEKMDAANQLRSFLTYRAAYFPTTHPLLYRTAEEDKYYFLPDALKQKIFKFNMQELREKARVNDNLPAFESLLLRESFPETVGFLGVEKEFNIYKLLIKMFKDYRRNDYHYLTEEFQHFLMAKICIPESFEQ